LKVEGIENPKE